MKKKILTGITAAALTAALLGGCGSSSQAPQNTAGSETTVENSEKTYTMFLRSTFVDWLEDLKWYDEAEKRTGVHVEYTKGPSNANEVYSEIDQRLISGTLTDSTMMKQAQANVYGSQGALKDLAPLIKEYGPNIQKYMDDNPEYAKMVTNSDGTIYGLLSENVKMSDFVFYRADHFKKAGIDPSTVKTTDDFTAALKALKACYGKDNSNYYPLCGRDTFLRLFYSWYGCASTISSEASHGVYYGALGAKSGFDIKNGNFYAMMEMLKDWYDEGLINPEWVAGSYSEGDWEAAMLNGDCSISSDFMTRPQWFMDNGGPQMDPDFEMAVLDNLVDENGNIIKYPCDVPYNETRATVINAKTSDETAATIIKFIDYFFSEEGETLANWGVEGESYKVVDGKKEYIADYAAEEGKPQGEKRWSFLSDRYTVCKPIDDEAFYAWNGDVVKDAATRLFTDDHLLKAYNIKYTSEQSKELDTLVGALGEPLVSELTAFVTGKTELNEANWQAFLDDMDSKGYSRIEEIQLEGFRSTYGQ